MHLEQMQLSVTISGDSAFVATELGECEVGGAVNLLFVCVAVSNNTQGAELVAVGKLIAAGGDLHHCLPDLRRLHRRADR